MWRDLLLGLLATVLTGIGTWALKTLIPYLRSLAEEKLLAVDVKTKDAIVDIVWSGVHAAEQVLKGKPGAEKFKYVFDFVQSMYEMDEDHLTVLIEQAVFELKLEMQGGE